MFRVLVDLHPVTHAGSRRMCLDPDVVPPLAGSVSMPSQMFSTMFSLCRLYAFLKLLTVFDLFITPDVLHISAGPYTKSQGDPGDPDIVLV
jgi:hypothetical protein